MLFNLAPNIGCFHDGVFAHKNQPGFPEKQRLAWNKVRAAIDKNLPCYGWELHIPEYYVINGYDDTGYYYSGAPGNASRGPKPWQELGASGIGVLQVYSISRTEPADDKKTVKEALQFAVEISGSPEKWIFPMYKAGLAGYDMWIGSLESGTAHPFGMAYNAQCWNECRQYAVAFLKEAKERLGSSVSGLLDEASGHYEVVARNLARVAELFPFKGPGVEPEQSGKATRESGVEALRKAREAEEQGLKALEKIALEL